MVQVINDPNRKTFGESFSTGLSHVLEGLVNAKANQMQRNQRTKFFKEAFPEIPESSLGFLSQFSPQEQLAIAQQYSSGLNQLQALQQPQTPQIQQPQPQQAQVSQASQMPSKKITPKQPSLLSGLGKGAAKTEAIETKEQGRIDNKYAKFNERIDQLRDNAEDIVADTDELLNLVNTGKVQFGLLGNLKSAIPYNLGTSFMNKETQQFIAGVNDLVDKDSAFTKGVATNFKIKLKQAAKAHLGQDPETAKKIFDRIRNEKQKFLNIAQARDQLIQENDNKIPDNIDVLARKRAKVWSTEQGPDVDPSDYSDEDVIQWKNSLWEKNPDGTGWQIYKGAIE